MVRAWMLAVVVLLAFAASAEAGTFTLTSCTGPAELPAPTTGWTAEGPSSADECGAGHGLVAHVGDHANGGWRFEAPSDTRIVGLSITRTASVGAGAVYTLVADGDVLETCSGACTSLDGVVDRSTAAHQLALRVSCDAPGCSATVRMTRAEILLEDTSPPVFTAAPGGTLLAGGTLSGPKTVEFAAADAGIGLFRLNVEVDGLTRVFMPLGCDYGAAFTFPCALTASRTLQVDTAWFDNGEHSVRIVLQDATESNSTAFGPFTITTANASPFSAPADPLPYLPHGAAVSSVDVPADPLPDSSHGSAVPLADVPATLSLGAVKRSVRAGSLVRFSGALRRCAASSSVDLQAFDRGRWRSLKTVRANREGAFSARYRFPSRLAGRTISVRAQGCTVASKRIAISVTR